VTKKSGDSTKLTGLRRRAEELLQTTKRDIAAMPVRDIQRLVHELQIHQIELEMQNEEMRQVQAEIEAVRDRYVELYDSAPTGYLTLDSKERILAANLPACTLCGINRKDLLGKSVTGFVAAKDQAAFLRHICELFKTGIRQACEVDIAQQGGVLLSVRFESVVAQDEAKQQAVVFTSLLDITERRRAETALRTYQQRLEQQRNLEERERLGHDLHDGILQSLYAVFLSLESSKECLLKTPDKAAAALTHSIGELNSVMRDVRTFIERLDQEGPLETDLSASLRTMAGTLALLHSQRVRVSIDPAAATGLSKAQGLEILNLAKEALSNSFRHSRAALVQFSFRQLQDGIRLIVQDNGRGLRRKGVREDGRGFVSMEARARRIGGTLSVQSKAAQGTRVVLDLPKKNSKEDVKP